VLESLALQRASGILEVDGDPAGAIYLDSGQITFARASWSPGLPARLRSAIHPGDDLPDLLSSDGQADADVGRLLIQRRYLTRASLRALLRSVVVDAVLVLTCRRPTTPRCPASGWRRPGRTGRPPFPGGRWSRCGPRQSAGPTGWPAITCPRPPP
jgi:hypothetical protein